MDMVNEGVPTYYYVDKEVPAAVEAAASTGGQIMPPIMGAPPMWRPPAGPR